MTNQSTLTTEDVLVIVLEEAEVQGPTDLTLASVAEVAA